MLRVLDIQKIPKPPFDYDQFERWRDKNKKLIVEIGCGVGFHPIRKAQHEPESQILAIERTTEKFNKFQTRLHRHPQLTNIFAAHAEAGVLLPHLIAKSEFSIDECYCLYPNPYPKEKHRNLRLAFSPLTQFIAQNLKPITGQLIIATNSASYAHEIRNHLSQNTGLVLRSESHIQSDIINNKSLNAQVNSLNDKQASQKLTEKIAILADQFQFFPRSHFEKKYFQRGETCYNFVFTRP